MMHIIVLKRSVLFVLLVSTSFNPLFAIEESKSYAIIQTKKQTPQIFYDIKNLLVDKGLTEESATSKVNKLFNKGVGKLSHLYNNPYLSISKENLNNALFKYALYEKNLDLNSYSSLVGFIQNIALEPLDKKQLEYIENLVSLS